MKWTRAQVEEIETGKGSEALQIDGIPEGFAWKRPNLNIGGVEIEGRFVVYGPLGNDVVECKEEKDLVAVYNHFIRGNKANHKGA